MHPGARLPRFGLSSYRAGMDFEHAYREGTPAWDVGAPQPAIVRLAESGVITGSVIDIGCGTGENALYLASRGHEALGLDFAPTAIERAREKAEERGIDVTFVVGDALALETLDRTFDNAIDCGLFHTFPDELRLEYERSLRRAIRPGGRVVILCFSERETGDGGPRRVTQAEIRAVFASGWTFDSIEPERFVARWPGGGAAAWLTVLTRI